jgi:hypothetical protein
VKISDLFCCYFFIPSSTASLFFFFLGTEQLLVAQHQNLLGLGIIKPAKVPKEYSAFDRLVFLYMFLEQDGQNA